MYWRKCHNRNIENILIEKGWEKYEWTDGTQATYTKNKMKITYCRNSREILCFFPNEKASK